VIEAGQGSVSVNWVAAYHTALQYWWKRALAAEAELKELKDATLGLAQSDQ
jgi:hypothetical protein